MCLIRGDCWLVACSTTHVVRVVSFQRRSESMTTDGTPGSEPPDRESEAAPD